MLTAIVQKKCEEVGVIYSFLFSLPPYEFIEKNQTETYLLNPGLLLNRRIRRDGNSSGGPLFVFVKNRDLGIFVSWW